VRAGILEQKGDVEAAPNDELIAEINDFDRAEVEAAAKKWRFSRTWDRAIPGPRPLLTSPATTT
jgi:hypothetical protein